MAKIKDKLVLMIMVDALRHDYINETDSPFLHQLSQNGTYGKLQPSFGFEPDGAYFAGLHPDECDGGAQFWHNTNETLFHYTDFFSFLFKLLPVPKWQKFIRKVIRYITQVKSKDSLTQKMATSAFIPVKILKHFSTPMKHISSDPDFIPDKTIFDLLRKNKHTFYFHGFPEFKVHTNTVLERYLNETGGDNQFGFLFFGDLDSKGHIYGPNSKERKDELKNIDSAINKILKHSETLYGSVDLLVFGDHGMVETKNNINLTKIINEHFSSKTNDKYFLDSTLARFWIQDEKKKQEVIKLLNEHSGGHVITNKEKDQFHINYPHNYFGDIIYATECGNLIEPCFYSDNNPPRGMHGYLDGCIDNESYFVISGPNVNNLGYIGKHDMRKVYPTILNMLDIDLPDNIDKNLKSILESK
ncbi:MAG: alkaline phosphatase family protein [Pseudomonadota bacterium]